MRRSSLLPSAALAVMFAFGCGGAPVEQQGEPDPDPAALPDAPPPQPDDPTIPDPNVPEPPPPVEPAPDSVPTPPPAPPGPMGG